MRRTLPFLLALVLAARAEPPPGLDVYFEESHAGSFYHLAATLPLDEPHTLVLIDAHSDSNGIPDSDRMRAAIRRVPDAAARADVLARWRREGAVQCYDWIEPLMPAPFSEVVWIAAPQLSRLEIGRRQTLARELLDGHTEAFPRESGALAEKFRATDWAAFEREMARWPKERHVVVSLDLDYFAATPDERLAAEFERVFAGILRVPGLCALTISRSTPFLRDAVQADRLTVLALDAATSIANARVTFAPFAETGPDRSLRARELAAQGRPLPRMDLRAAPPELRTLLLTRTGPGLARVEMRGDTGPLLAAWRADPFLPAASVAGEVAEPDGWHRLRADGGHRLRVAHADGGKVRWFALVPTVPSTNVAGLALGFADDAPRWLRRVPQPIGEGAELSLVALAPLLEPTTRAGSALVFAEVGRDGERWRTNILRLELLAGGGFRSALSGQFARPYAFGCGLLAADGPDALVAADCANFLIAALRRDGWRLPWGNPKQLAAHLEEAGACRDFARDRPLPLRAEDVAAGLFIHLGSHVAAVWEDRAPLGRLDPGDLVAHHLEGLPEIVPLARLMRGRAGFRLMRLPPPPAAARLVIGGDVMLGRGVAERIEKGGDPFAGIAPLLRGAELALVNLECVASPLGQPVPGQPFHFRAHPRAPELLAAAGVDVVSLANNHAGDFGPDAARDAAERLRAAGLRGAGGEPVRVEIHGRRFVIFACASTADEPLLAQIRAAGDATVIVLPHWGTEHDPAPDDEQHALAARLVAAGADIIAGSGPHTRQPLVFENGALVSYSLGNLIFDGPGPDLGWSRGALLEVTVASDGRIIRARELPVAIAPDGTPRLPGDNATSPR
jgi:hypothetical protein